MPKYDLIFGSPLMNAAGSLGFAPDPRGPVDLTHLGAFVTNPLSRRGRTPAHGRRLLQYPGGFLLHTGYPNPGLSKALRRYASHWARSNLPVLVHLLGEDPDELAEMVKRLETVAGVAGIELGLPPGCEIPGALALVAAANGELPVIVRLPLERAVELGQALAALPGASVSALSLGAPRGALPGPGGALLTGRLYGPAVFPLALLTVQSLANTGLPIIGAGGVYRAEQAAAMLSAGAIAVQLDAVLWSRGIEPLEVEG
jgi:dihydroorotate dehydrogenase (NAD+) catalytic subunit